MFWVLSRQQQALDGLIRKRNDRRPRSRTACVACACGCGDQKEQLETHTYTAEEKRGEEQAACTAAAASIRPSHSPIKSQAPTPTPPPSPSTTLSLFPRTHERSGYPCPAEKEKRSFAGEPSSPGKKDKKRRFFASCTGYSNNKAAGREKISVDSFTVLFLRQILIPSSPHHRPITASSSVARRRRPAGGTSQRRPAVVIPRARSEANRVHDARSSTTAAAAAGMGSFKGHVLPGTLFLLVGAWHVWAAVARFAADPLAFRLRVWNPVGGGKLRHLELYVVAGGAFLDMCIEVLYSTHLHIFAPGGGVNPAHLNDLEHGGMLLMFFLLGALALISQNTRYLPLTEGALCLVSATAFTAEFLLFYFHSTTHQGLEGYYHYLLVLLIGLCVVTSVLGALLPESFPADLASGMLITLQGLWFYQTAFTLYGSMLPEGCHRDADGHIDCHGHAAGERAEQLANFQLFAYVFLVFVYTLGCYAVAAARYGHPDLKTMHATAMERRDNGADRGGFVATLSREQGVI